MKKITLFIILSLFFYSCKAQEKVTITLRYIGYKYNTTHNSSFISMGLQFLKEGSDTVSINKKLPFDTTEHKVYDLGIYYNCHLKEGTVYTITLKKICTDSIPDIPNDYYKLNTIPDKNDCSKFVEFEKHTPYKYEGNYEKYVDINNTLYEIIGLSPPDGCFFSN